MALSPNRGWPLPRSPWVMNQTWMHLLFLHYPVSPDVVAPLLPQGMELDLYEGSAWLSIVPFQMRDVRPRFLPPIPGVSTFNELNVRTYVTMDGKPGVYFFSLDAHSWPTVWGGRTFFHLAYHHASMKLLRERDGYRYTSKRTANPDIQFACSYAPLSDSDSGSAQMAEPGSLNEFLVERYGLYSEHKGKLYRGDIDHRPWKLRQARFEIERNTMLQPFGLALPAPTLAHYSERIDVHCWFVQRIR
ncbi:hypothetical protein A8990_11686 [Paenibacillus taihuensis]|uniref:DUF2071 domain-containing protein n=1 Tax=Paenibacillus taihuensis TaxID=1156355 RepID=A0A3D9RVM7_9BACL|nr:DUF2071 domain-containing protein [Paenibacillus taihuensis]REE83907.1 hypothetical protein A8990_11686 [Paenibacillus taihuensis]